MVKRNHNVRAYLTNVGFIVLGVYLAISVFSTVRQNYRLQKQINDIQRQNDELEQANEDLQYQIAYFSTDSFKEKEARAKLGLQQPGESVIILPKKAAPVTQAAKPKPTKANFWQWIDFLRGIGS